MSGRPDVKGNGQLHAAGLYACPYALRRFPPEPGAASQRQPVDGR